MILSFWVSATGKIVLAMNEEEKALEEQDFSGRTGIQF